MEQEASEDRDIRHVRMDIAVTQGDTLEVTLQALCGGLQVSHVVTDHSVPNHGNPEVEFTGTIGELRKLALRWAGGDLHTAMSAIDPGNTDWDEAVGLWTHDVRTREKWQQAKAVAENTLADDLGEVARQYRRGEITAADVSRCVHLVVLKHDEYLQAAHDDWAENGA